MEITLHDVINWIVDHSEDEEAMTKIAVTAYPFSSRFKQRYPDRKPVLPHHADGGDFSIDVRI